MEIATTGQAQQCVVASDDVVVIDRAGTLWGLFCERVRRSPDSIAYRSHDPGAGHWCDYT